MGRPSPKHSSSTATARTASGSSALFSKPFVHSVVAAFYVLATTLATLSLCDGLPTALKVAYIPVVAIAVISLAFGIGRSRAAVSGPYLAEYGVYIVLMFALSCVIYTIALAEPAQMARGYEKLAYQLLTVLITVSAFHLFGKKAMDYTFYGFVLFWLIAIVYGLSKTGPSAAASDIVYFLSSGGDAAGFMKYMELHDAAFAFGAFIVYYAVDGPRKNFEKLTVAVLFFAMGYKRIGILAVAAALLLLWLIRRHRFDVYRTSMIVGAVFLVLGFAYIVFVSQGSFSSLEASTGVNSMGRSDLYEFIGEFYQVDPTFAGRGFEFIQQLMQNAHYKTLNLAKIGAIHNGYLTIFIEFGFFGFFIWTGFWLLHHANWTRRFGDGAMMMQLIMTVYLFVTYFTDNTAFYFSTGIVARLAPMLFAQPVPGFRSSFAAARVKGAKLSRRFKETIAGGVAAFQEGDDRYHGMEEAPGNPTGDIEREAAEARGADGAVP